ncbi:hypothetical protein [Pedobacter sp. ASV28]|uniref:hypothetical protein n=1 Tax=Pedobacter sp. ASV28 TaxID=2795123 RepID=UPI0018EAB3F3|nr:hypothetical protein [Pedobacter sp. ASV28]
MKKFRKLLAISSCLIVLTVLFSCKKDKDTDKSHEVEYKVIASSNATISAVVHTNVQGDATTLTSIGSNTWSAKVTVQAGVQAISLGANAIATDATGTLRIQIIVDGVVVKENTSSGQALSATAVYYTMNN